MVAGASSNNVQGRSGFMLGSAFRPRDSDEVQDFYSSEQYFLDNDTQSGAASEAATPGADLQSLHDNYLGPLSFWGDDNNGTYSPIISTNTPTATTDNNFSFSAADLRRRHTVIIVMEGVTAGTSFELEVIRRIEGIPNESNMSREKHAHQLSESYSTPLDILRKTNFADFYRPYHTFMDEEEIYVGAFWNSPFFQDAL